jgi:hypothetical protein
MNPEYAPTAAEISQMGVDPHHSGNGDGYPPPPPSPTADYEFGALAGIFDGALRTPPSSRPRLALLRDSYFTDSRGLTLLHALRQLDLDSRPLDAVSTLDYLTAHKQLDAAGGPTFVASLDSFCGCCFEGNLDIIRDRAIRRKLSQFSTLITEAVADISIDPAQILSQLKDAADSIVASSSENQLDALLAKRHFNPAITPPDIRPVFTLANHVICTPANLTAITASVKAGKTAAIAAMIASAFPHSPDADMLGFQSSNPNQKALLHFDSEQSPDDHWHVINRSLRRAELSAPPPWFHSFCLTGLGHSLAWSAIQRAIHSAAASHSAIHSIFLDGIADLVADVNNPAECNAFVASLHDLAIHYDCPIIGVIHFNPGSESKTRGHLGSQFERKSETNLRLDKSDEITTIWSDKQRREPILKGSGPAFKWHVAVKMHILTESAQNLEEKQRFYDLQSLATDIFTDHPSMRYSDIVTTANSTFKIPERSAQRKVSEMSRLGIIKKAFGNLYTLTT